MDSAIWSGRIFGQWARLEREHRGYMFRCSPLEITTRGSLCLKFTEHGDHGCICIGIPFLLNIYISTPIWNWMKGYDDPSWGFYYFERAFWLQWGDHTKAIRMPWDSEWTSTEILDHDGACVWMDTRQGRKYARRFCEKRGDATPFSIFGDMDVRRLAEEKVARVYDYTYTLESGEVQKRKATVHVDRMTWGYRWWPFPVNIRTSISVRFDQEVGERTGSWKGGCTGCGYDMLTGETPEMTLRRMEKERKF